MSDPLRTIVPTATYDAWPALRRTAFECFIDSPELYYGSYIMGWWPRLISPAMKLGIDFHKIVLEGAAYWCEDWGISPPEPENRVGLSWEDCLLVNTLLSSLHDKPSRDAYKLIYETKGENEVSILWDDDPRGFPRKVRLDRDCDSIIVDLKMVQSVAPEAIKRDIVKRRYYRQAPYYLDAIRALSGPGKPLPRWFFVCVEKNPPYRWEVFHLEDEFLQRGHDENQEHLSRYAWCLKNNQWHRPDKGTGCSIPIAMPAYLKAERSLEWRDD